MSLFALNLTSYELVLQHRAQWLLVAIALGYIAGSVFAQGYFSRSVRSLQRIITWLQKKLDRPQRSVATLVYRGIVAVMMVLLPTVLCASLLTAYAPALILALAIPWFGYCYETVPSFLVWRQAQRGQLPLEYNDYLFADSHGVIRHLIRTRLNAFATGVVGASCWYMIGGLVGGSVYLTVAAMGSTYRTAAFGWAARSLFWLMNLVPQLMVRLLLVIAAILTPSTRPLHALTARAWPLFCARLLDISLGGASPAGDIAWVGDGTPKPEPQALYALLTLIGAATILLIVLLGVPQLAALIAIFL